MSLHLHPLAHSEIGLLRKNNQDSGYVSPTMLLVADGMGGAAAGDLASAVATRELAKADKGTSTPQDRLKEAVARANDALMDLIAADPTVDGMGTTLCGGIFDGASLWIVHIGDSRAYLYRNGELSRITHDHSYVQSLIDDGKLNETEALSHPNRSLLLRVLNGQWYTEPEFLSVDLEVGDRVMFCSDGLCGLVPDEVISNLLTIPSADKAMAQLIEAAHLASGSDNITIVIADVDEQEDPTPTTSQVEPTLVAPKNHDPKTTTDSPKDFQLPLPIVGFTTSGLVGAAADADITKAIPGARLTSRRTSRQVQSTTKTEKDRYTPRERRSFKGLIAIVICVILGLGLGAWGVFAYASSQYYVSDSDGQVVIYQGLDGDILGFPTSRVIETTTIKLTDLPTSYRDKVADGIHATSGGLDQSHATVHELETLSATCVTQRENRPPGQGPGEDGC